MDLLVKSKKQLADSLLLKQILLKKRLNLQRVALFCREKAIVWKYEKLLKVTVFIKNHKGLWSNRN